MLQNASSSSKHSSCARMRACTHARTYAHFSCRLVYVPRRSRVFRQREIYAYAHTRANGCTWTHLTVGPYGAPICTHVHVVTEEDKLDYRECWRSWSAAHVGYGWVTSTFINYNAKRWNEIYGALKGKSLFFYKKKRESSLSWNFI